MKQKFFKNILILGSVLLLGGSTIINTKSRKSRKKPKEIKTANAKKKKTTLSYLDYEELKKAKEKLLKRGSKDIAIKYIEKMVPLCTDLGELCSLMLELADLLFELGHLEKAGRLYDEFIHMYPGDEKAEYASYKSILCCYWKTLDYYRDQSKTEETVEKSKQFLERKKLFTTYADEVETILTSCNEKLLDSEINIFNFYLKQNNFLAAETRLKNIETDFLPILPAKEPVLLTLACDLAEKQNNQLLLAEKKNLLEQKFPDFVQQKTVVADAKQKRSIDKF